MNSGSKLAALVLATLIGAGSAHAQNEPQARQGVRAQSSSTYLVLAHDLDLHSSAGREALLQRVELASRRFCQRDTIRSLQAGCFKKVRAEAVETSPMLLRSALVAAMHSRVGTGVVLRVAAR